MRLGLALSGGAARGIAHIGALKAFEERGINFDVVSGCSAGAMVGAMYCAGYSPEEMMNIVRSLRVPKMIHFAWSRKGVFNLQKIMKLVEKYLPANRFSALNKKFFINATNLTTGKEQIFGTGELFRPLLASCAIPVLFEAVDFNGQMYIDGGFSNNLPVDPLVGHSDIIFGVNVTSIEKDHDIGKKDMRYIFLRSVMFLADGAARPSKGKCDYLVEPKGLVKFHPLELHHVDDIFEMGYKYTSNYLDNQDLSDIMVG
ncbi:patatin-like phospholipase family protein [Aureibacter tunicatorum]|uniref:NTE family protein n=1 Tax=Aureibacter tunicatorum TaxID=866807 RepID=A0AAE4BSZ8_9BACT|nr:patatin-like phospholipase family protein [Aureibacter tunicatorum]MDR6239440.1 NTE family protein [Aureibacter tunicatorum]BDD04637.1 hypothetical protein AUTU_21200 [Aureibacter tunicatorum]